MYDVERQNKIIELLKQRKSISVQKLVELLYISPATARRDLSALEKRGVVKRTFGGAVLAEASNEENNLVIQEQIMVKSKRYMCEKCASLISNNQSVFLDSSSTVANLVPFLSDFHYLSIVTNGLNISALISKNTNFRVFSVGGEIVARSNSTIGPVAQRVLSQFHCDICIHSCSGIDIQSGVTEGSLEQSSVKETMLKNSSIKILLADCTKFGKSFLSKTCDIKEYDILITDQKPAQEYIDYCLKNEVKLMY
jgi:DeoR/GlpR family transcriptional regulator of sugar metabolism